MTDGHTGSLEGGKVEDQGYIARPFTDGLSRLIVFHFGMYHEYHVLNIFCLEEASLVTKHVNLFQDIN